MFPFKYFFENFFVLSNILLVTSGMQSQDHEKVVHRIISPLIFPHFERTWNVSTIFRHVHKTAKSKC